MIETVLEGIGHRLHLCHPPLEHVEMIEGKPHQVHYCPPCFHGCVRMYAYERPEPPLDHPSALLVQSLIHHEQLDALTCLDHE